MEILLEDYLGLLLAVNPTCGGFRKHLPIPRELYGGLLTIVDGVPPGLTVTAEIIQAELDKRKPGQSELDSPRKEIDRVYIFSGVMEDDKTTGEPVGMVIPNVDIEDIHIQQYRDYREIVRPGHAEYTLFSKIGIEILDSPWVIINMHIMTRVGTKEISSLGENEEFIPCIHLVGALLAKGQKNALWPCAPIEKKYICYFLDENLIRSYGSGYDGNALWEKKCLSLWIESVIDSRQDWLAEHTLILHMTSPSGKIYYICAALPSAFDKTNLAMISPDLPGWKAECLGNDILSVINEIELEDLKLQAGTTKKFLEVNTSGWKQHLPAIEEQLKKFSSRQLQSLN